MVSILHIYQISSVNRHCSVDLVFDLFDGDYRSATNRDAVVELFSIHGLMFSTPPPPQVRISGLSCFHCHYIAAL